MTYTFKKEIIKFDDPLHNGSIEGDRLYKVYYGENLVGEFYSSGSFASFKYADQDFIVDIEKKFWSDSKYIILHKKDNLKLGEYEISSIGTYKNRIGTLIYNNTAYKCKRVKPEVNYNLFKKDSWGHFKVMFYNDFEEVIYRIKVETSFIKVSEYEFSPATGEIESNTNNLFVIFSGIFLLERVLDISDDIS